MDQYALSALITSIATFLLAIFVITRNVKSRLYRIFAIYSFCITIWTSCLAIHSFTTNRIIAVVFAHLMHVGAILIPVTFVHFMFVFIDGSIVGRSKKNLQILYFLATCLIVLTFFPTFVDVIIPPYGLSFFVSPGNIFYHLHVIYVVGCIFYGLSRMFIEYLHSSGVRHNQMKYLFWSSLIGYLGGVNNYLVVYDIRIFPLYPYGTYAVTGYVIVTAYVILKYRLMGIKPAMQKTIVPILTVVSLGGLIFAVLTIYPLLRKYSYNYIEVIVVLFLGGILLVIIYKIISKYIDKYFPQKNYNELLYDYKRRVGERTSVEEVFGDIIKILQDKDSPHPKSALIFWQRISEHSYLLQKSFAREFRNNIEIASSSSLVQFIETHYLPLDGIAELAPILIKDELHKIFPEVEIKRVVEELTVLKTQICMPLIYRLNSTRYLQGMICLGEPELSDVYDDKDYDFFKDIASSLSQSIINVEARKTVNEKNRLSFLSKMFVGWRHQITNILNNINVAAFGIQFTEDSQEINNIAQQIYDNSMKAGKIVDQSSQFTKVIDSKNIVGISLCTVLQEIIESLKSTDNVHLVNELSKDLPNVEGDRDCIKTSLLYLLENAMHAVSIPNREEGEGLVTIRGHLNKYGTDIEIEIEDNGTGMGPATLKDIGTPFMMPDDVKGTPTGTGLSVALVYYYIQNLHNGKVRVESELGSGSTFYITLPIKYNRAEI